MKKLNVMFIPTSSSGVAYWRIQNFVEAAWNTGCSNFVNPLWFKDSNDIQEWQIKLSDGPKYDPIYIRHFIPAIESGCQKADAVVFQYGHTDGAVDLFESIRIKYPHLPLLTEIDDNILAVPEYNEAAAVYDPRSAVRAIAVNQMKMSDGVIVSTPYLKEVFGDFNENIRVIPNSIDFSRWEKLRKKSRSGIRIGWAGGNGHEGDFSLVGDAIKRICSKHREVKFIFLNGPAKRGLPDFLRGVKGVEHQMKWVPISKYPQMMSDQDFDIIIAPTMDSAFNRGKSNLKWLEAAALKIPCVMMNVGHYAQTVKDGVDGFLADTEDDFFDALDKLILDRKLRQRVGLSANAAVRRDFNVSKIVKSYVAALEQTIAMKHSGDIAPLSTPVVPDDAHMPQLYTGVIQ